MSPTIGISSIISGSIMSGASSSGAGWSTLLEPSPSPNDWPHRQDDPRLGEVIERWEGDLTALTPGRGVLLGFPQDEGVRRNHGRPGAAEAPCEIRHWLYRLTRWDAETGLDLGANPPLDMGNVSLSDDLEESQQALGRMIHFLLER